MEQKHIIEFNTYFDSGFYYIEPIVDGRNKKRLSVKFLTIETLEAYLKEHREELEKKYTPKPREPRNVQPVQESNDKKAGKIAFFGLGALAGVVTTAIILTSCEGCKGKGTKRATSTPTATAIITPYMPEEPNVTESVTLIPGNISTVTETPVPTSVPVIETPAPTKVPVTETPAPTEEALSGAFIENKSVELFNEYFDISSSIKGVTKENNLIGNVFTAEDFKRAITILNIDNLSLEHYDVFRELVSNKEPNALYSQNNRFMASLVAMNMDNYEVNKTTDNFILFSPLLLDENEQKDMQELEKLIIKSLNSNLEKGSSKTISSIKELKDLLSDQKMLNRSNGFNMIKWAYLEIIYNECQNKMTNNQYRFIGKHKESMRVASYQGIMNILNNTNKDYGCYIETENVLVRTRHC